jgi:heat shock protein HslJ
MPARRLLALALLGLAAAGCRPADPVDAGPVDTGPEAADPGLEAPAADAASGALPTDLPLPFRARGNEPFWALELDAMALAWRPMDGGERVFSHLVHDPLAGGGHAVEARLDGTLLRVEIEPRLCRDNMSGMPYPRSVRVHLGDREFRGCGGEAIELLAGRTWTVASIDGTTVAGPAPTLEFLAEGRAAGFGGCNRWMAGANLTGESLAFERAASTMMACPEPAMRAERAFLDALAKVTRHDFDEAGNLLLKAGDTTVIVAAPTSAQVAPAGAPAS